LRAPATIIVVFLDVVPKIPVSAVTVAIADLVPWEAAQAIDAANDIARTPDRR
jgi:hypothetical protein